MIGMRPGGRRIITIPARKAYGRDGLGPLVPPDATVQIGAYYKVHSAQSTLDILRTHVILNRMYADRDSTTVIQFDQLFHACSVSFFWRYKMI